MDNLLNGSGKLRIALATEQERETIYRLRHDVYARELVQHPENSAGKLKDSLDTFNTYITASLNGKIVGFISITPPDQSGYSIDKYFSRHELPIVFNEQLYEIRILTVIKPYRGNSIAGLLMYAALRWVEAQGGKRIVVLGRREVLGIYLKVGLQLVGRQTKSGAVTFELLSAKTSQIRERLTRYASKLRELEYKIEWQLGIPFRESEACYHGGAFFEAIGDEFDHLERSQRIINADVLDAWYPPSPKVLAALQEYLPWLLKTSPPTSCRGMIRTISRVRGIASDCILSGAGSSNLIFLAFRQWLTPASRTLILDPTYGEYAHVLEQIIGCRVDRLPLKRSGGYQLDLSELEARFKHAYDLIILVNPNSPTGRHIPPEQLEAVLKQAPTTTIIWIDETYIDYTGSDQSLEAFAAHSKNIIVCKSMSKVYALSGARVAYLCGPPTLIAGLRKITPPWAVSLPAQVAAVMALQDQDYYTERYAETHILRNQLAEALLTASDMEIIPGSANFMFCHLPVDKPDVATVVAQCRASGLFLRDATTMGTQLGRHALRIAVKDAQVNRQIVKILSAALNGQDS